MAYTTVVLDTGPLSLLAMPLGHKQGDACRAWLTSILQAGIWVIAPEISDYEARRELLRAGKTASVAELDALESALPDGYLPITTEAMRKAAELWAEARNNHYATADPKALDGDVILAAQALTLDVDTDEIVIATTNVGHLSRYIAADLWQKITP